ncbi:hypothetical protein, partial [Tritonibacter sp. SIMBA_163]|uniref:hypothetical protein n=1 Tax=Tritonibacter sp. SIMBA_163 TaxID=3080868 RepID=UPI0039809F01
IGLEYIKDYPFRGYGPNQFYNLTLNSTHPHNGFINLAVGYSSVALVLLTALLIVIFFRSIRQLRNDVSESAFLKPFHF